MEAEIGITSALGRRYFELIHKLDQLMPLLQTLEIEEVITERQVEHQRSKSKRLVLAMASTARNFAAGIRRRMNEIDAKKLDGEAKRGSAQSEGVDAPVGGDSGEPALDRVGEPAAIIDVAPATETETETVEIETEIVAESP